MIMVSQNSFGITAKEAETISIKTREDRKNEYNKKLIKETDKFIKKFDKEIIEAAKGGECFLGFDYLIYVDHDKVLKYFEDQGFKIHRDIYDNKYHNAHNVVWCDFV